jgi:hypothetical protein
MQLTGRARSREVGSSQALRTRFTLDLPVQAVVSVAKFTKMM